MMIIIIMIIIIIIITIIIIIIIIIIIVISDIVYEAHFCKGIDRVSAIHISDNFLVVPKIKEMVLNMSVMIFCTAVEAIKSIKASICWSTFPVIESQMPLSCHVSSVT